MKHNSIVKKAQLGDDTIVNILSKSESVSYRYKTNEAYKSNYLSIENLSYYISENDEDEEDDYLLYHALQEDKKLCITFWTKNVELIQLVFNDTEKYNCVTIDTWKNEYSMVFVARKGCLSDYFDLDEIDDWYAEHGIYCNYGLLGGMFNTEMIGLLSGEYTFSAFDTPYNVIIDFEGDAVLRDYGMEGLVIAGLLLGYPLEATADLIKSKMLYFISHPRF